MAESLEEFLDYKGEIYSAHREMPDLSTFISNRFKTGTERFQALDLKKVFTVEHRAHHFDHIFDSKSAVVGDSHALSAYHPNHMMFRNDGMTLYGMAQRGLKHLIPADMESLVLYFGSIDVRHHLLRHSNVGREAESLMFKYERRIKEYGINDITLVHLLPVEHEERKIPKTGYYKGTPFYGTRQQRLDLVRGINLSLSEMAEKNGWRVHEWPKEWYSLPGDQFAKMFMESGSSVHLARSAYIYDFDTNEVNNWRAKIK